MITSSTLFIIISKINLNPSHHSPNVQLFFYFYLTHSLGILIHFPQALTLFHFLPQLLFDLLFFIRGKVLCCIIKSFLLLLLLFFLYISLGALFSYLSSFSLSKPKILKFKTHKPLSPSPNANSLC